MKSSRSFWRDPRYRKRRILAFVLLLSAALLWTGVQVTQSNAFCSSCHSMGPYTKSMAKDLAHKDFDCVDCHLPDRFPARYTALAGFVIGDTLASMKSNEEQHFNAHVPDSNCMSASCHGDQEWKEKLTNTRNPLFRNFLHNPHFDTILPDGQRMQCTSCHVGDSNPPKTSQGHFRVNPETCFLCHLARREYRSAFPGLEKDKKCYCCHDRNGLSQRIGHPETGDEEDVVIFFDQLHILSKLNVSEEEEEEEPDFAGVLRPHLPCIICHPLQARPLNLVDTLQCQTCHIGLDISKELEGPEAHRLHVSEKQADCFDCHSKKIRHNVNDKDVFSQLNCYECHPDYVRRFTSSAIMYFGHVPGFVSADPMAKAGVKCSSCHIQRKEGCSDGTRSCGICHIKRYNKLVGIWQKTTNSKLQTVLKYLEQAAEKGLLDELPPELEGFLKVLKEDGSHGVHNIFLVNGVLSGCLKRLKPLLAEEPE